MFLYVLLKRLFVDCDGMGESVIVRVDKILIYGFFFYILFKNVNV